jgi:hypothetical protein
MTHRVVRRFLVGLLAIGVIAGLAAWLILRPTYETVMVPKLVYQTVATARSDFTPTCHDLIRTWRTFALEDTNSPRDEFFNSLAEDAWVDVRCEK